MMIEFDVRKVARALFEKENAPLKFDEIGRLGVDAVLPYYARAQDIAMMPATQKQ